MKTRIITSIVGLAVLAVVMMFFDTPVLEAIVALITLIAVHEVYRAFGFGKKEIYLFAAFIPFVFLVMFSGYHFVGQLLVPLTYLFMVYLAVCLIAHSRTLNAAKMGGVVTFSSIIIAGFFSFVYIKNKLPMDAYGYEAIYLILLGLAFAWGGDSCAYFAGRFFGKHKLAPIVSPKKTVEGAVGGVLGSGIVGVLCTLVAHNFSYGAGDAIVYATGSTFGYVTIFVLGMICSILGILGDLFASAVKRQCEIKDYGTIFPGHGGIMDRFDSVLFIMPVVAIAVWLSATFLNG